MKNEKLEGVTRGDKLCKSRGGENSGAILGKIGYNINVT